MQLIPWSWTKYGCCPSIDLEGSSSDRLHVSHYFSHVSLCVCYANAFAVSFILSTHSNKRHFPLPTSLLISRSLCDLLAAGFARVDVEDTASSHLDVNQNALAGDRRARGTCQSDSRHQTLWSQHMILFQNRGMPTSLAETDSSCIAARFLRFQFENIKTNHPTSCKKLVIDNQTNQDDTMWYHDTQPFFGTHQWPTRIISNIIGLGRCSSTRALSSCSTTGGVQRCCCCCCGMKHFYVVFPWTKWVIGMIGPRIYGGFSWWNRIIPIMGSLSLSQFMDRGVCCGCMCLCQLSTFWCFLMFRFLCIFRELLWGH